jgi:predicted phosphohydrolase
VKIGFITPEHAKRGFSEGGLEDLWIIFRPHLHKRVIWPVQGMEGSPSDYPMTTTSPSKSINKLLWLTDIHLDRASEETKSRFLDKLAGISYDALLITGDISVAEHLTKHLAEISWACQERNVYFTLGNHCYFGSSFVEVDRRVADLCRQRSNLVPLGHGEVVQLTQNTALVGHRGWYCGQAGAGEGTRIECPDRQRIKDFRGLTKAGFFSKLKDLGRESAHYFRQVLPKALDGSKNVILATHVPPFTQGLGHSGGFCDWNRQPFFSNREAGNVIFSIAKQFALRNIVVHSGHTHCPVEADLLPNLQIRVGGAQPGFPAFPEFLTIE